MLLYFVRKEIFDMDHHNKKDILKESNLTYDDYASLNDGNRYELVQGKLELMSPSPSTIHQLILSELDDVISLNCKADYFIFFAPIDVILSENEVRQPDLVLVNRKRIDILSNRGIVGSPDLVVEILSPNSLKRDKVDKLNTYEHYDIPEYWIVDPHHGSLEQYLLNDRRYELKNIFQDEDTIKSPTIPCVSFTMNQIMDSIPHIED